MPITSDFHRRNFITKITSYKKIINVQNSMTILDDLLPVSLKMILKNLTGVYNFCNPGTLCHNEVVELYKKFIDNSYEYQNFSVEEQSKILKCGRSNNELDCSKLIRDMPEVSNMNIQDSIIKVFKRMKEKL